MLLSCFVHERKHRLIKRYCNEITNTTTFESTALKEVICHHLAKLDSTDTFNFSIGLVSPYEARRKLRSWIVKTFEISTTTVVRTAAEARISAFATCRTDDVVLVREGTSFKAGQIKRHFECNGVAFSVVSVWDLHRRISTEAAEWLRRDNSYGVYECSDLLDAVIWTQSSNAVIRTLLPHQFR